MRGHPPDPRYVDPEYTPRNSDNIRGPPTEFAAWMQRHRPPNTRRWPRRDDRHEKPSFYANPPSKSHNIPGTRTRGYHTHHSTRTVSTSGTGQRPYSNTTTRNWKGPMPGQGFAGNMLDGFEFDGMLEAAEDFLDDDIDTEGYDGWEGDYNSEEDGKPEEDDDAPRAASSKVKVKVGKPPPAVDESIVGKDQKAASKPKPKKKSKKPPPPNSESSEEEQEEPAPRSKRKKEQKKSKKAKAGSDGNESEGPAPRKEKRKQKKQKPEPEIEQDPHDDSCSTCGSEE